MCNRNGKPDGHEFTAGDLCDRAAASTGQMS
jgi:hypothetical protein